MTKKKKKISSTGKSALLMLTPGVVIILAFIYYPIFRGSIMAFQNYTLWDIFDRKFVGLDNFKAVLTNGDFLMIAKNTAL